MKLSYLLSLCCLLMFTSLKAQRNILTLAVFPQQAAVLESQAYNLDLLTADFENDSLRINEVYPWRGNSAFFITYKNLIP